MKDEIRTPETTETKVETPETTTTESKPETKKSAPKKRKLPFTQAQVDAVAEQHWWRKTADSTMCKKVDISQETLDKIRASSQYKTKIETLMLGQYDEKGFERFVVKYPEKDMPKEFGKRMHIDPKLVMPMVERVRKAHKAIANGKKKAPKMLTNPYKRS